MFDKLKIVLRNIIGNKNYEQIIFLLKNHYWPNLKNPSTFNEKIASLKLTSNRDQRFVELSDKFKVRDYVKQKIGEDFLVKIYGSYEKSDDFNLEKLPDQFVLKANHASGADFIRIIRSKEEVDEDELKKWTDWALTQNFGRRTNEWWYEQIYPRKVIAEELLNPDGSDLKDYKFMVINGEISFIQVDQSRFTNHQRNLYDVSWNEIDVTYKYPKGGMVEKPKKLKEMVDIVLKLSESFNICRVDLYLTNNKKIKFGELTFAPEAARGRFQPKRFDTEFGRKVRQDD